MAERVPSGVEGVVEESVVFEREAAGRSLQLVGTLALPEVLPPAPATAVVTIHGWAGTRTGPHRLFVRLGRALAAAGVPALRFDLSGRGVSDGQAPTTCLDDMIADTVAAVRFLREHVGCRQTALCGICSGGNVAIGAATLEPVRALALISTLPFAPRTGRMAWRKTTAYLKKYAAKALEADSWKRLVRGQIDPEGVARTLAASGRESAEDRKLKDSRRDIPAAFAALAVPCLFVYGDADPEARPAWEHYHDFCRRHDIPVESLFVEGANHNYYSRTWSRQVEDAVESFLLR